MDFEYTEQQKAIQAAVREFSEKEVMPGVEERERKEEFPTELYKQMGKLGFTGIIFPEEYGGTGGDFLSYCLIAEEVSRCDPALGITLQVSVDSGRRVLILGTGEQKSRCLPPIAKGEAIAAAAITEPEAGSDVRGIKTTAKLMDNEWIINGTKAFITNAGTEISAFSVVLTRTEKGYSYFIVPTGTPGYEVMPKYRKIGLRSSDTRELVFRDCRIPKNYILGVDGKALSQALADLSYGRIVMASNALGLARSCLEDSLPYAKERKAFGRSISEFQYIQQMLVEMHVNIESGRLLRDKAVWVYEQGNPDIRLASIAKLVCTEGAKRNADLAVQIYGAMGYIEETSVARHYRDARVFTIFDGTSEIQKHVIARQLLR